MCKQNRGAGWALEQANEVRWARAQLKKELTSGKIGLAQILAKPPAYVLTAPVRDLLWVVPRIGSVKAGRILGRCRIAHSKTAGGLSERQRAELGANEPFRHGIRPWRPLTCSSRPAR